MFKLIIIIFILLFMISFWGDYEENEKKEDYRKFEEITNEKEKP